VNGSFQRYCILKTVEKMNNEDIRTAVEKWFTNRAEAELIYGHISKWDTSNVSDMSNLFKDRKNFNEDINSWNVANVTPMERVFEGASSFNQPLEQWNVASVTPMERMFGGASSFNQPQEEWDVANVTTMRYMFSGASSFNQPLASICEQIGRRRMGVRLGWQLGR
jgi:hypothetical protein